MTPLSGGGRFMPAPSSSRYQLASIGGQDVAQQHEQQGEIDRGERRADRAMGEQEILQGGARRLDDEEVEERGQAEGEEDPEGATVDGGAGGREGEGGQDVALVHL